MLFRSTKEDSSPTVRIVDDILKAVRSDAKMPPVIVGSTAATKDYVQKNWNEMTARLPDAIKKVVTDVHGKLHLSDSVQGGSFTQEVSFPAGKTAIGGTLNVPFKQTDGASMSPKSVMAHEVMHAAEYSSPSIHNLVAAFREHRLYSYNPEVTERFDIPNGIIGRVVHGQVRPFAERVAVIQSPLGHDATLDMVYGYMPTFPDKYGDPYSGRLYTSGYDQIVSIGGKATSRPFSRQMSNEQLTTAVQAILYGQSAPTRFGNIDSEHIAFGLGVLLTAGAQ